MVGGRLAIIQDDANFIAVLDPSDGRIESITLPAGAGGTRQFDDRRGNKRFKLDLEASVAVIDEGRTTLFAFGSGSSAARERIAIVRGWDSDAISIELVAAPALYRALREAPAFAGSELNLEGAALMGDELWLFGRGNGAPRGDFRPLNATCVLRWADIRAHLRSPETSAPPVPARVTRYDLGVLGAIGLGFTDAIAVGTSFLYSAAAEDSPDAVTDGPVEGSCLGVISLDGSVRWAPLLDAGGRLFVGKVEGIAWPTPARDQLSAVLDHDEPGTPSELCIIALEGPWFDS